MNKSIKRRSIFRWLHNQKFHFTFLQETYSSKECAQIWEAEWGGKVYFSHGSSHSKGVMTLVTPNLDVKVEKCIQDTNGRFLILDLLIDELHLILVNIYAPNDANQQVTFFKELENQLEDFAQENIIIAGDFNCALSENDKKGGNPVWKKSIVIKEGLFFRKNTQQLEKKKANFNWQNQYCQDIRFVETHILQFLTDRI